MANPGVGTKFVSVNLNKSYGQSHPHHYQSHPGHYGSNRTRPGSHGGGGGMVVLSRPRSSQKSGTKLSVPPPLNLPSLRKEHERFDSLGSTAGLAGGGVAGSGQRPTSAGMGWTKPGMIASQENEEFGDHAADGIDEALHNVDGVSRGGSVYLPPSARPGMAGPIASVSASSRANPPAERATVLRGEDFPSLQAVLPSAAGTVQKQKDSLNQKQKPAVEEPRNEQRVTSHLSSHVHSPQLHSSQHGISNGMAESDGINWSLGSSRASEHDRKQEDNFPGPLPLVRFHPRSDWADDERDTSHGLTDRGRDYGISKREAFWERDFDMPRVSAFPQKPVNNIPERRGLRDNETGKFSSSEVPKVDPYVREMRTPSREGREGNFRRNSPFPIEVIKGSDIESDRNDFSARTSSLNREINKDSKYSSPFYNADNDIGRRDIGYGQGGRRPWSDPVDPYGSRGTERITKDRYGCEQHNRNRGDALQNSSARKYSFSSGVKVLPVNDPLLNFGRDKPPFTKSAKPYFEDPFMKDFGPTVFDGRDPLSGSLVGVAKRKKDVVKHNDYHDPIRESFEAELERVQKMQEQERQRIVEEQERALEVARREEEERMRLFREQEERQRKLEEEAREAAWRAEQEQQEAMQRAEEQRIAREEEKRRILMEEERRKQAAKQKLLELEERMARKQVETVKPGTPVNPEVKVPVMVAEKDVPGVADMGDWDDSERMVKGIPNSPSYRPFDLGSRPNSHSYSSGLLDRGKPFNSWRRDFNENGSSSTFLVQDQENGHHRRDALSGRAQPRKEFHLGAGFTSSRISHKGWVSESPIDNYTHAREQRYNFSGDGEHYSRSMESDSEFHDNIENIDLRWGQDHARGISYSPYPERLYPNTEVDGPYSFGRSRYSMKQPRVLPPPSVAHMQKSLYRGESEHPDPPAYPEKEMQYSCPSRHEPTKETGYGCIPRESLAQGEIIDVLPKNTGTEEQRPNSNTTLRCDSQSTLSVSSPPNSPTHLSHDDLDVSGNSPVLSAGGEGKDIPASFEENEPVSLHAKEGTDNMTASTMVSAGDEDEWAVDNNEQLQEQEEYDEDEDGYREEDEVHEGDDENIDFSQEFENLHLKEQGSSNVMENLILGFNEGVEVGMPNDEFERISRKEESMYLTPQISTPGIGERGSFDGVHVDGKSCEAVDGSSQMIDGSSRMFQETELMRDFVLQANPVPQTSVASEPEDQANALSCCGSFVQPVSASIIVTSQSGPTVNSNVPALSSQAELPVKLQFGLFTGPPLIPSPVPAIQIGSIQMPLHLHPQVGPSLTHMSKSQPPLFQFGQLRYTSPISQGVRPLHSQSVSFIQPNVKAGFHVNQKLGGALSIQPGKETYDRDLRNNDIVSLSIDHQPGFVSKPLDLSQGDVPRESNSLLPRENTEHTVVNQQGEVEVSGISGGNTRSEPAFQAQGQKQNISVLDDRSILPSEKESIVNPQIKVVQYHSVSTEKILSGSKARGPISSGRGKRHIFTVKNGSRSSLPASESTQLDSNGFQRRPHRSTQRTEFRVRENVESKQSNGLGHDIPTTSEVSARSGPKRFAISSKSLKQASEPESLSFDSINSRDLDAGNRAGRGLRKEFLPKSHSIPHSIEGKLKRNISSGENIDAPLQSGIVRVFEQPGIEAPSDDDDFIEVRSKRQMLNDRREQREKEIKEKFRVSKILRKPHSTSKSSIAAASRSKTSAAMVGDTARTIRSDFVATDGCGVGNIEVKSGFNATTVSQPLAPIGTPSVKNGSKSDARSQTISSLQTRSPIAGGGASIAPSMIFESNNSVLDGAQTSLGSWGNASINQQVMALTQTQLDEAMKPAQFDSHPPVGVHTSSVSDPNLPSSSMLTKDNSFSSTCPISSVLAGENIQFGAVTSPGILHSSSRAIMQGILPSGPTLPDIQFSQKFSGTENDCRLFFDKERHSSESCVHLDDCEAEAEAAASAVAVAAISSDEIISNGLGTRAVSVSVSDTKKFGSIDTNGITAVAVDDQQLASQSRAEESLTVALPADLSVETPPISLWPPLNSPHNSSSQMLSHFPGPPSHFPFYEMNPMLGGPVFAFGPHDDSVSTTQSQSQKGGAPTSGSLGNWQQCHSGVDSFYGPPAGFTGSFISPPGGIPGVQGPPHMVVYNHFAPVGQFGQVGLSFMGATYISSGKQPDWRHDPTSSALPVGEMNNLNMVPAQAQRNPTNIPSPIQHLAPGSPLMPMPSPLAIFDVSPFQSSPDMSVQARWSHVAASSVQSIPLSLQQQPESVVPSQFSHASSVDHSLTASRRSQSQVSASSDHDQSFSLANDSNVVQLPDELGIVDATTTATATGASAKTTLINSSSVSRITDSKKTDVLSGINGQNSGTNSKTLTSHHKSFSTQQYSHSSSYNYNRGGGGSSQKNSSGGGEWSHRRIAYQGRNPPLGPEKTFPTSKMKQIYVAKQTSNGKTTG